MFKVLWTFMLVIVGAARFSPATPTLQSTSGLLCEAKECHKAQVYADSMCAPTTSCWFENAYLYLCDGTQIPPCSECSSCKDWAWHYCSPNPTDDCIVKESWKCMCYYENE